MSVARCSKRVYLPGSYVQPAAIDALTECFGRALNIWNACGGSNMDAVACEFMAGRYRHGISINAEQ